MSVPLNTKIQSDASSCLLARSYLYGVAAYFYRHPASIDTGSLSKGQKELWLKAALAVNSDDGKSLEELISLLLKEAENLDRQKWISLYEDCFSHTAHGAAPLYELEYGESDTYRQPQQLADIAAFYQAFGLKVNERSHERVDHIAVECEFMHFLLFKEVYALEHGDEEKAAICHEAAGKFMAEHLGSWAPSFTSRALKKAPEGLFRYLVEFTRHFIFGECRTWGLNLGTLDLPLRSVKENYDAGCVSCLSRKEFRAHDH